MRPRIVVVGALLLAASRLAQAVEAPPAPAPLVLAVNPYATKAEIVRRLSPFAAYVGRAIGQPITVRVGGTYAEHVFAIGHDEVDIAFVGPAPFIRVLERFGSKPILARFEVAEGKSLRGVIAVRSDSPIRSLAELRGRRVAFADPDSTMGYYVPAWMMLKAGVPLTALGGYRFVAIHPNVAVGVLSGDFDAGAMMREVYERFAPRGLRILAETSAAPERLFITRSTLAPALIERLRATLLTMHESPEGLAALHTLLPDLARLVPASEADYQPLRVIMKELAAGPH